MVAYGDFESTIYPFASDSSMNLHVASNSSSVWQ